MGKSKSVFIGWLPLLILPVAVAILLHKAVPRWALMWFITAAIFFSFKWLTWCMSRRPLAGSPRRIAWWFFWPGMAVERFLSNRPQAPSIYPQPVEWLAASFKTGFGVALFPCGVELVRTGHHYLGGWCGMIGMVLILHFGAFHLVSCATEERESTHRRSWNVRCSLKVLASSGADVGTARSATQPMWRCFSQWPVVSAAQTAMWSVFLFSGLIHEAGISVPAGAGFGLPTLYFILQALALSLQNSAFGRRRSLGQAVPGRVVTLFAVFGFVPILFHPAFVYRVGVPFMKAICSV